MAEIKLDRRVRALVDCDGRGRLWVERIGTVMDIFPGFGVQLVTVRLDIGGTATVPDSHVRCLLDAPLEISRHEITRALLGNRAPALNADEFETKMLQLLARQEQREGATRE